MSTTTNIIGSDPILSWGSSVNVCEDLRRQIRSEIESIEVDVSSLKTNLKAEERASAHIAKGLSYARSEMLNLVQESAEELETAMVNEQIRLKMEETLKNELVLKVVSPPSSTDSITKDDGGRLEHDEGETIHGQSHQEKDSKSYNTFLSSLNTEKKTLQKNICKEIEELRQLKMKIHQTSKEYESVRKTLDSNELAQEKHKAAVEVEASQKENEKELKKMRAVKDAIHTARKLCADYAQQIVDKVNDYR